MLVPLKRLKTLEKRQHSSFYLAVLLLCCCVLLVPLSLFHYYCFMDFVKPTQLSRVIGITPDGLRKQRIRGSSPYEYEIIGGKVLYNVSSLPPSVRENIEDTTKKKTRRKHEDLLKDHRYMHGLGKINERKKQLAKKKVPRSDFQVPSRNNHKPRIKKQYAYWSNPYALGNHWNSIEDYENSKKKKKVESIY